MNVQAAPPPRSAGELPPKKVAWLHPVELLRTGYNVWLSTTAKEYIDRRETLAALGNITIAKDGLPDAAFVRGQAVDAVYNPDRDESGLWIDFVADIGDSWEATFSIATLLAKPKLTVRGHDGTLPAAAAIVLGGDLVYPTPSREGYRRKTRSPFEGALPECPNGKPPCLFAIPGNHDWYDGLTSFVREFCQGGMLGGWRMLQRRSYFAVKLTPGWWLWGIDIALDTRIDPPQQAYFLNILNNEESPERFCRGDNIILCTAKPVWTESSRRPSEAYRNLNYFVSSIVGRHGHVRAILAGDLHHYSRYENTTRDQLITAGGGGAYLTGTQHLPTRVAEVAADRALRDEPEAPAAAAYRVAEFPYPSRPDSRRMALGALLLAFRPANWPFTFFVMGALYAIFVRNLRQVVTVHELTIQELVRLPLDLLLISRSGDVWNMVAIALGAGALVTASSERAASRWLTIPWGLLHGFLHLLIAVILLALAGRWSVEHKILEALPDFRRFLYPPLAELVPELVFCAVIVLAGGIVGASLVGIYFVVSDRLFGWHTNEVFASQSIINYRNFVRMNIAADGSRLTIYPVGLRTVPKKWRLRLNRDKGEPLYEPTDEVLTPHLIEGPIEVPQRR